MLSTRFDVLSITLLDVRPGILYTALVAIVEGADPVLICQISLSPKLYADSKICFWCSRIICPSKNTITLLEWL